MGKRRIFTNEELRSAVAANRSMAGVMRTLGYTYLAGGTHSHVARRVKAIGISTAHFLGRGTNCGPNKKGGPEALRADSILVLRTEGYRTRAKYLRRALLEIGREYICASCQIEPVWNGDTLRLEVEHKNHNFLDDRAENLEFLCPNCHSQRKGSWNTGATTLTGLKYAPMAEHQTRHS